MPGEAKTHSDKTHYEVIVVGAGVAGIYQIKRLVDLGIDATVLDSAPDRRLLSGDALDGKEAHQALGGGLRIDGHGEFLWLERSMIILSGIVFRNGPAAP